MKAFTDIEQSKALAKILPIESADMAWCNNSIKGVNYTDQFSANLYTVKEMRDVFDKTLRGWDKYWKLIPCWSLAALLEIIPKNIEGLNRLRIDFDNVDFSIWYDDLKGYGVNDKLPDITLKEPVDACYEMIVKLKEKGII